MECLWPQNKTTSILAKGGGGFEICNKNQFLSEIFLTKCHYVTELTLYFVFEVAIKHLTYLPFFFRDLCESWFDLGARHHKIVGKSVRRQTKSHNFAPKLVKVLHKSFLQLLQ